MFVSLEPCAIIHGISQCKLLADGSTSGAGAGGLHIGTIELYQKELEPHVRQVLKFSASQVFPLDLAWFLAAAMPGTSVDDHKQRMNGLSRT